MRRAENLLNIAAQREAQGMPQTAALLRGEFQRLMTGEAASIDAQLGEIGHSVDLLNAAMTPPPVETGGTGGGGGDWLDSYANWFNSTTPYAQEYYTQPVGNAVHSALVDSGLFENDTLANATANELAWPPSAWRPPWSSRRTSRCPPLRRAPPAARRPSAPPGRP